MHESVYQYSQQRLVRYRMLSVACALLAMSIGGAALLGWILDVNFLKRIHPDLVTMKANTAVCLILISSAVLLVRNHSTANWKRRLAQSFAVIVALVGLLTLTQHLFNLNLGIDQLLFTETTEEAGQSFPGRMGIAASLIFPCLGCAVLFVDARSSRWFRVSNIAVLLVMSLTVLVFLYYFYGIESSDPIGLYFTIALHTVVAFLSLCAAILFMRPDRGLLAILLEDGPGGVVTRRMWPMLLVVMLLGWARTMGRDAGFFGAGFANAMFVLTILLILVALIWWTAFSLNRTDRERRVRRKTSSPALPCQRTGAHGARSLRALLRRH